MKFWDFFSTKKARAAPGEIACAELLAAAQEFSIRNLCFSICANMIASALARCEFRTFRQNKEVREEEYYLWNVEPNINQNSTAFLHKLVWKLYSDNEALVVATRRRDGAESLVVADSWQPGKRFPVRQNEYAGIVVGDMQYEKTFREADVLHLVLNNENIRPALDKLHGSFSRLLNAAMKHYAWSNGQHWKVAVSQFAQGDEDWIKNFRNMIADQLKPFIENDAAVLPQFEGYEYEQIARDKAETAQDIRDLTEEIFDFTARAFNLPVVLVSGKVEATSDANQRFLTYVIDPLCDQLQEEITRKRYGYEKWRTGAYLKIDSSSIIHYDLFSQANSVEKLIGSGVYTINDILRAAGQPELLDRWANEHYMTLNIAGMSEQTRTLGGGKE